MPIVSTPSASRPTNDFVVLVSYSGDVSCVDAISFKTYGKLRWPGFIFRPTKNSVDLVSYSGDVSCVDAISFKTYGKLRWPGFIFKPMNDIVLASYSGDVGCVDAISFKTYGKLRRSGFIFWGRRLCRRHQLQDLRETPSAWFHLLGMSVMSTPLASRPMGNSVVLVSSSGDVGYVDAISFKTYGKLHQAGFIFWCWNW
ncbi:hypothetical protein Taro_027041 [Colocasia esculenta]|uniref:Uncharacterized protein n=1 Tax=Colocasia esculenta TaxID=4460 RepID=A0A843VCX7_COLES|nr:hypothetical protein [Colocasia esculenta]